MTNSLNLDDILKMVSSEEHDESPRRSHPQQSAPLMPFNESALQEADLSRLVAEAEKNVKARNGIIGMALAKLRGNEIERLQYENQVSVIKAAGISEEAQVALLLALSLQVFGFKIAVSAIDEMERYGNRFDADSAAGRMGRTLLSDSESSLRQISSHINTVGRKRILKATNMG